MLEQTSASVEAELYKVIQQSDTLAAASST